MEVTDFIKITLNGIKDLQQKGYHYFSFGLIAQGIELLGACLDNHDFFDEGHSRKRFALAVNQLFPQQYHAYLIKNAPHDLYKNLRCGLLHILLPNSGIELIQQNEVTKFGPHLTIMNVRNRARLILVAEELLRDFEIACNGLLQQITNKAIQHPKVYTDFMGTEP